MNSCLTFVCSCLLCLCNCFSPSASKHVTVLFQRATLARRILHTYVYVSWEPSALWNTGKLNFPSGGSRTSSIFGDEVLGKCFRAARGARITALLCNPSAPKRDWPWTCQTTSEHIPSSSTQATENLNKEAIKKKTTQPQVASHPCDSGSWLQACVDLEGNLFCRYRASRQKFEMLCWKKKKKHAKIRQSWKIWI